MRNEREIEKAFWSLLRSETTSTVLLYKKIIRNPFLLILGTYQVMRDIFYELPRSFFSKKHTENLEIHLEKSASQCITISEIITIPGNYLGFIIMQIVGLSDFLASIIGANIGDYFSSACSYTLFYVILTRGHGKSYTIKNATYDCVEVIKDCLPAAIILYVSEAPFMGLLLGVGLSPTWTIAINLVVAMTIYIGVAKYSTTKNIEKHFH